MSSNCIVDYSQTKEIDASENIGGRIQIKLGYDPGTLQLIVTIICAVSLTIRANGAARNPYAKVKYYCNKIFGFEI